MRDVFCFVRQPLLYIYILFGMLPSHQPTMEFNFIFDGKDFQSQTTSIEF